MAIRRRGHEQGPAVTMRGRRAAAVGGRSRRRLLRATRKRQVRGLCAQESACEPSTTGPCCSLTAGGCMCGEEHMDSWAADRGGRLQKAHIILLRWLIHACRL